MARASSSFPPSEPSDGPRYHQTALQRPYDALEGSSDVCVISNESSGGGLQFGFPVPSQEILMPDRILTVSAPSLGRQRRDESKMLQRAASEPQSDRIQFQLPRPQLLPPVSSASSSSSATATFHGSPQPWESPFSHSQSQHTRHRSSGGSLDSAQSGEEHKGSILSPSADQDSGYGLRDQGRYHHSFHLPRPDSPLADPKLNHPTHQQHGSVSRDENDPLSGNGRNFPHLENRASPFPLEGIVRPSPRQLQVPNHVPTDYHQYHHHDGRHHQYRQQHSNSINISNNPKRFFLPFQQKDSKGEGLREGDGYDDRSHLLTGSPSHPSSDENEVIPLGRIHSTVLPRDSSDENLSTTDNSVELPQSLSPVGDHFKLEPRPTLPLQDDFAAWIHVEDAPVTPNTLLAAPATASRPQLTPGKEESGKPLPLAATVSVSQRPRQSDDSRRRRGQGNLERPVSSKEEASAGSRPSTCSCRRTKCLKLYCDCFARLEACGPHCGCICCYNRLDIEVATVREAAVASTLTRNPRAFFRGRKSLSETLAAAGVQRPEDVGMRPIPDHIGVHRKDWGSHDDVIIGATQSTPFGCACKKSACTKKYCECFQAGVRCGVNCKCSGCKNCETSELPSRLGLKRTFSRARSLSAERKIGRSSPDPHPE